VNRNLFYRKLKQQKVLSRHPIKKSSPDKNMKNLLISLTLFIFCTVAAFAQTETDLARDDLKGSVKYIESYEIAFWGAEDERNHGTRNMEGIINFDRAGNILESIFFTNDSNGSYYEKYVHFYDLGGVKFSTTKYISSKNKPGVFFDSEVSENWYYNLILKLKESLSTRTFYKRDQKGRIIEQSVITAKGSLEERKVFVYDENGKNTRFSIYNADNALTPDVLTEYKKNGLTAESVRTENGVEVSKVFDCYDKKGRIIKQEQFMLKPATDSSNAKEFVLRSRSTNKFDGDKMEMEWIIFDENGTPNQKLIIIDINDDEHSRDSYEYRISSDDGDAKPEWHLKEREFRKYEYDKHGNWIKCTWLRQENPSKPPFPTSIYERAISYY
jgi:hypothetical protein